MQWIDMSVYGLRLTLQARSSGLKLALEALDDAGRANLARLERPLEEPDTARRALIVEQGFHREDLDGEAPTLVRPREGFSAGALRRLFPEARVTDLPKEEIQRDYRDRALREHSGEAEAVRHEDLGRKVGGARKDRFEPMTRQAGAAQESELQLPGGDGADTVALDSLKAMALKERIWPALDKKALKEMGADASKVVLAQRLRARMPPKPKIAEWASERSQRFELLRYIHGMERLRDEINDWLKKPLALESDERSVSTVYHTLRGYLEQKVAHLRVINPADDETVSIQIALGKPLRRFCFYRSTNHKALVEASNASWDTLIRPRGQSKAGSDTPARPKIPRPPHLTHIQREGIDWRHGRDVTGEQLLREFGFSGIEYGNWVGQKERQEVLNLAYDAFADLAMMLEVPPRSLGLNRLALAFGARGNGGRAVAHYEPGADVINLTRVRGAGSLAHEWAHALDNALGRSEGDCSMLSKALERGVAIAPAYLESSRMSDMAKAMYRFLWSARHKRLADTVVREQAQKSLDKALSCAADWLRSGLRGRVSPGHPMVVHDGIRDDASAREQVTKDRREFIRFLYEEGRKQGKYVIDDEVLYDHLQQMDPAKKRVTMIKKPREQILDPWYREYRKFADILEHGEKSKFYVGVAEIKSGFLTEAEKLDKGRNPKYWSTPHELFARAFESCLMDQMTERGWRNDYLVAHAKAELFADARQWRGNPYPSGEHRQALVEESKALFSSIAETLRQKAPDTDQAEETTGARAAGR